MFNSNNAVIKSCRILVATPFRVVAAQLIPSAGRNSRSRPTRLESRQLVDIISIRRRWCSLIEFCGWVNSSGSRVALKRFSYSTKFHEIRMVFRTSVIALFFDYGEARLGRKLAVRDNFVQFCERKKKRKSGFYRGYEKILSAKVVRY